MGTLPKKILLRWQLCCQPASRVRQYNYRTNDGGVAISL